METTTAFFSAILFFRFPTFPGLPPARSPSFPAPFRFRFPLLYSYKELVFLPLRSSCRAEVVVSNFRGSFFYSFLVYAIGVFSASPQVLASPPPPGCLLFLPVSLLPPMLRITLINEDVPPSIASTESRGFLWRKTPFILWSFSVSLPFFGRDAFVLSS